MLPKNRDQKGIVPGYQGQCPDRRFHFPVAMGHVGVLFGRLAPVYYAMGFQQGSLQMAGEAGRSAIGPMDGRLLPGMPSPLGAQAERLEL